MHIDTCVYIYIYISPVASHRFSAGASFICFLLLFFFLESSNSINSHISSSNSNNNTKNISNSINNNNSMIVIIITDKQAPTKGRNLPESRKWAFRMKPLSFCKVEHIIALQKVVLLFFGALHASPSNHRPASFLFIGSLMLYHK